MTFELYYGGPGETPLDASDAAGFYGEDIMDDDRRLLVQQVAGSGSESNASTLRRDGAATPSTSSTRP